MHREPIAHPPASDFFDDETFVATLAQEKTHDRSRTEALAAVRLAGATPGSAILDAGTGTGRHALELAEAGYLVTGLDHAATLLTAARSASGGRPWPRFVQGDYDRLPFAEASFDAVLCLGSSLGYQGEAGDRAALAEFRRVLRPGGRLVIETFHRDELRQALPAHEERLLAGGARLRFSRSFDASVGVLREEQQLVRPTGAETLRSYEVRLYRPGELCLLLHRAGFANVSYHGRLAPSPRAGSSAPLVVLADTIAPTPHRAAMDLARSGHTQYGYPQGVMLRSMDLPRMRTLWSDRMSTTSEKSYTVQGMTCGHCELSVREEVEELAGIESADADRGTGRLVVRGEAIDDAAVRGAVQAAGYELVA